MALVLHKVLVDGSTVHEDFDKASWEAAGRDPLVARRWGHPPDECVDPVEAVRGRSRTVTVAIAQAAVPGIRTGKIEGPQSSFDFGEET